MLSKQKIVAAAIGLSMMVLPATALAGHHDRWSGGPMCNYRHDNGRHVGWWKHGHDWDHDGDWNHPWYYHHEPDRDDYRPVWNHHHEPDDDDYPQGSYYHHEPDADDYNYGAMPYGRSVGEQIEYLMQRRAITYRLYRQARNRHDSGAESRLSASIHSIDARIRRLRQANGYAPIATPYGYAPGYAPLSFAGNPYFGNNYAGNPYMGSAYPYNNPTVNALSALVGPMLGIPY